MVDNLNIICLDNHLNGYPGQDEVFLILQLKLQLSLQMPQASHREGR